MKGDDYSQTFLKAFFTIVTNLVIIGFIAYSYHEGQRHQKELVESCIKYALPKTLTVCFGVMDCEDREFNQSVHYGKLVRCMNGLDNRGNK